MMNVRKGFAVIAITAAAFGLAGCQATTGTKTSGQVALANEGVVFSAPAGYCLARSSRQSAQNSNFLLFGDCAALTKDPNRSTAPHQSVLSASLGPALDAPVESRFDVIEAFVRSDAGRSVMARSGKASDVTVLSRQVAGDVLLLKIRDTSATKDQPVAQDYWRAVTGLNGRVATLSVLPKKTAPMSDREQARLLLEFAARSKAATASGKKQ
ncbi:hypothetical protein ERN12_10935 [Rhodobacteraceae bacterium]|nr:hypothetical protein ERN12_10935 [Paracoccaceae bacterium]